MRTVSLALLLAAATALALAPGQSRAATLALSAEARERAVPDIAEVGAGVVTQAETAEAALADNARRMAAVVRALRAQGIAERDIRTSGLGVQPQFRYEPNREPILVGFLARNQVQVVLRDLDRAGRLIDLLVRAGANQIDGPSFRVDRPEPILDRARAQAVRIARQRADLYAAAAGLRVKRITAIREAHELRPVPPPMPAPRMMATAAEALPASPVLPGEMELIATVSMEFELE